MKKILTLTAITMLLASTSGCECWRGFWRGSAYPVGAEAAVCDPCVTAPSCGPVGCAPTGCAPCGAGTTTVVPAPTTTYVPGPVN